MELVREYLDGSKQSSYVYKFDNSKLKKLFSKYNIKECIKKEMKDIALLTKGPHLNLQNTIATLIYRYTLPINLPIVDILQGPVSCYKFIHPTLPHIIYAFGDCHINQNECPDKLNIADLLKVYSRNAPIFLDIFLEKEFEHKTKYIPKGISTNIYQDSYLNQIYKTFDKSCWSILKKGCNENTTRLHYTDLRNFHSSEQESKLLKILENFYAFEQISLNGLKIPFSKIEYEAIKRESILNFKLHIDEMDSFYKSTKDNIRNSFKYTRVIKQIQNIPNENIKNTLQTQFTKRVANEINYLPIIDFKKLQSKSDQEIEKTCGNFYDKLVTEFYMIFMDYYLIARILRTFSHIPNKYNEPCYNSIICAGMFHIDNYKAMLTSLGFEIIEQTYNKITSGCKNAQCLNMKNITQPLFSSRF